jgi:hypothetical protein
LIQLGHPEKLTGRYYWRVIMATTGGGCVQGSVTRAIEDTVMTKKIIFDTKIIGNKRSNAFGF